MPSARIFSTILVVLLALAPLPGAAQVTVAELVPEVVTWNHGPLGEVAGHPLRDPRVTVAVADDVLLALIDAEPV